MLPWLAAPALALGENGTFELPLETETVSLLPSATTTLPLAALVRDGQQAELDLSSARLRIPEELSAADAELMQLESDGRSLTVDGEGTWSVFDDELVFTPESGTGEASLPIALTLLSVHETRSQPATLTPETLELGEVEVRASSGVDVEVPLADDVPEGGTVRLGLDGLPAGSSLTEDGSRLVVPDQGTWQLDPTGETLTYSPTSTDLGLQVDPVRYEVRDEEGAAVSAGRVLLSVPIIDDVDRAAPYGEDIEFTVGEHQQFVDLDTLALEVPEGVEGAVVDDGGTRVTVPGQGEWNLDRSDGTVRFSPEGNTVTAASAMGVTGADEDGNRADPGLMHPAYPILVDRVGSTGPAGTVVIDLAPGMEAVTPDSLQLAAGEAGEAATVSEDGRRVEVEGQGVWELEITAQSQLVTFDAEDDFLGQAAPIALQGRGLYADHEVEATLGATVSPVVPTARDDEARTGPQQGITVDVLRNDTAGSTSQPLDTDTVQLRSLAASNLPELSEGTGTRLVIPGEGTYTVGESGAVTFVPAAGFTGRTTPVEYLVRDDEGVPVSAELVIEVDESAVPADETGADPGGINTLLSGILPSSPTTSLMFGTIVLLLVVGGGASLAIGIRIELEKHRWDD